VWGWVRSRRVLVLSAAGLVAVAATVVVPVIALSGSPKPPLSTSARQACTRLEAQLPSSLGSSSVTSRTPTATTWGQGAVRLTCAVARPGGLTATAQLYRIAGRHQGSVLWLPNSENSEFFAVDRQVFIGVTMSAGEPVPLPVLSDSIAEALPAVCVSIDDEPAKNQTRYPLCADRS
jgi:Protein of unknown function (DUF3515)